MLYCVVVCVDEGRYTLSMCRREGQRAAFGAGSLLPLWDPGIISRLSLQALLPTGPSQWPSLPFFFEFWIVERLKNRVPSPKSRKEGGMQGSLCQISLAKPEAQRISSFPKVARGVVIEFVPQDYPEWSLYRLHPLDQESLFVSQG